MNHDTRDVTVKKEENNLINHLARCDVCKKDNLVNYTRFNGHGTICDVCADAAMIKAIDDAWKSRKQNTQ